MHGSYPNPNMCNYGYQSKIAFPGNLTRTMTSSSHPVDVLILGAGWTSSFLIPLLREQSIPFAATSRDGGDRSGHDSIKFQFDPTSNDPAPFAVLPDAKTVLITFPIYKSGASERFVNLWRETHKNSEAGFIQLGSTGIWNVRSNFVATFSDHRQRGG